MSGKTTGRITIKPWFVRYEIKVEELGFRIYVWFDGDVTVETFGAGEEAVYSYDDVSLLEQAFRVTNELIDALKIGDQANINRVLKLYEGEDDPG